MTDATTDAMTDAFNAVGRTCLLTTALRSVESGRPDRLYTDPYAARLAGEAGFALLAEVAKVNAAAQAEVARTGGKGIPSTVDFNAIRVRFLDDRLLGAVNAGIRQIVMLAAGMDTRAYRLDWPAPKPTFFEIDQPSVIGAKNAALADCPDLPDVDVRRIPLDLTGADWPDALRASGYDPTQRSVWVLEGLLYYLSDTQVEQLLSRVRTLSCPGSMVAADLVSRTAMDAPHLKAMLDVYAEWGTPFVSGADDPADLFRRHGVDVTVYQPGEPGASYGRWHDPVPPASDRVTERLFLVYGERQ